MDELDALLEKALMAAKDLNPARESALIVTKIQEAQFWAADHRKALRKLAATHEIKTTTQTPPV